jgi:hypothetical protein
MRETDLYPSIKSFLERQGYEVKAEVKSCDVVARKPGAPLLVVELKLGFTLQLIYQAVDRLAITDHVYVAIAKPKRGLPREAVKLCRRLGLGLILIGTLGGIEVLTEPAAYAPRQSANRKQKLVKEFNARSGDPNLGGSGGTKLMTAYKQDALRCLSHLQAQGPTKLAALRQATKVERAAGIMRNNYYGWFQNTSRGVYELTAEGETAVTIFVEHISALK